MTRICILLGFLAIACLVLTIGSATAGDVNQTSGSKAWGKPFRHLQRQINQLEAQLYEIKSRRVAKVYDANNQYLGNLVEGRDDIFIYIPKLRAVARIDLRTGNIWTARVNFERNNCTGTAYNYGAYIVRDYQEGVGSRFYKHILERALIVTRSHRDNNTGLCDRSGTSYSFFELVEIFEEDFPFDLPVALPLEYR